MKMHQRRTQASTKKKLDTKRSSPAYRAESTSAALTAVAFQDHLARNLNLSLSDRSIIKNVKATAQTKPSKCVKAVVNTGRGSGHKQTRKAQEVEKEYVLDPEPKPLSLAQKFGLVDAPAQPLSDTEWKSLKQKSNEREDSCLPCVICKEDFGLQSQYSSSMKVISLYCQSDLVNNLVASIKPEKPKLKVLLSCSHVFHKNCLVAFERFTGKKTCPMCRKEQYQTRVIYEGARLCRTQSAITIQAAWRGYIVRRWYTKLRETVPPNDPVLRKRYFEEKLGRITERLVRSLGNGSIDDFLCEIDRSVKASRTVFERLDKSTLRLISNEEWEQILQKVETRGFQDCPICIMPLSSSAISPKPSLSTRREKEKQSVLLSCTHLFHGACLEAFEELSFLEEVVCPVCRSHYQKRYL